MAGCSEQVRDHSGSTNCENYFDYVRNIISLKKKKKKIIITLLLEILSLATYVTLQRRILTFRHRASSIYDRHFATLQRTLFIYLINKYISLSDICLTVHH